MTTETVQSVVALAEEVPETRISPGWLAGLYLAKLRLYEISVINLLYEDS
jgi:hypothetical protein